MQPDSELSVGEWRRVAFAAIAAFALTALFRFLALTGFPNDQYEHLAGAQQMLFGERPGRDFLDPGMPLMYAASAAAQLVFGRPLLAEALLDFSMLGLAAALTVLGAYVVTRSMRFAVAAAAIEVLMFPRPYAYPRLLCLGAGAIAIWAWTRQPRFTRLGLIAVATVVAFLFRYDLGAYVGIAGAVAVAAMPASSWRVRATRLAALGAMTIVLLVPYAAALGGPRALVDSMTKFVVYGMRHAQRNALRLDHLGNAYESLLFWGFNAMPFVALTAIIIVRVRRPFSPQDAAIAGWIALAIAANHFLIGDTLVSRLPDAVVANVLLFAWIGGQAVGMTPGRTRNIAIALVTLCLVATAGAAVIIEKIPEQIRKTGLISRRGIWVPGLVHTRASQLTARFEPQQVPDRSLLPLVPFFDYLDRCAAPTDRLFVASYAPQIYVYARHPFGGGQKVFLQGSFDSAADQQFIVDRLTRQRILFALAYADEFESWRRSFPHVASFVEAHYTPLTNVRAPNRTILILVNGAIQPAGRDAATGWPCYVR